MKIIVEEEFGYKYYMWTTPFSTAEDLIEWWNALKALCNYGCSISSRSRNRN